MIDGAQDDGAKEQGIATRGSLLRDPAFTYLYFLACPREKLGPGMLTLRNHRCLSDFSGWRARPSGICNSGLGVMHPVRGKQSSTSPGAGEFPHVLVCYVSTSSSHYAVCAALLVTTKSERAHSSQLAAGWFRCSGLGVASKLATWSYMRRPTQNLCPSGKAALFSWTPAAAALEG